MFAQLLSAALALAGSSSPLAARQSAARSAPRMSDRQQRHKVVVTGVSAVTSCGHNIDEMMVNLLAGKSGIDRITSFDPTPFGCQIGSEVKDFPFDKYIDPKVRARARARARLPRARAGPPVLRGAGAARPRASARACRGSPRASVAPRAERLAHAPAARAPARPRVGGEAQRQVHASGDGDREAGGGGRGPRPGHHRQGALRRADGLGHRRDRLVREERGDHVHQGPEARLALLHPDGDWQYGLGHHRHRARRKGAKLWRGLGVRDGHARDRRGGQVHRARLGRRDARRRLGGRRDAAQLRGLLQHARHVHRHERQPEGLVTPLRREALRVHHGRGLGHAAPRVRGARPRARRQNLLRARGIRRDVRRAPHHGAAPRGRGPRGRARGGHRAGRHRQGARPRGARARPGCAPARVPACASRAWR